MRFLFTILATSFCYSCLLSQDIQFEVRGTNAKPIGQDHLAKAETLKDINPGYPSSWIKESDYISTEVLATKDGANYKANGNNENLTEEQRLILNSADLGTDIHITVRYKSMLKDKVMNFSVTVAPKEMAQYIGGEDALNAYFQETALNKLVEIGLPDTLSMLVHFTVNEFGRPVNPSISERAKNERIDEIIINAIRKMPSWTPAIDDTGKAVQQQFVLSLGNIGC